MEETIFDIGAVVDSLNALRDSKTQPIALGDFVDTTPGNAPRHLAFLYHLFRGKVIHESGDYSLVQQLTPEQEELSRHFHYTGFSDPDGNNFFPSLFSTPFGHLSIERGHKTQGNPIDWSSLGNYYETLKLVLNDSLRMSDGRELPFQTKIRITAQASSPDDDFLVQVNYRYPSWSSPSSVKPQAVLPPELFLKPHVGYSLVNAF